MKRNLVLLASASLILGSVGISSAHAAPNAPKPTIITLTGANGQSPSAGPTCITGQPYSFDGLDWCFGATYLGGKVGYGSIWMARPDATQFQSIGYFDLGNGLEPSQGPVINADRTALFGVTSQGGSSGIGIIYKVDLTQSGASNPLTPIASFSPLAGGTPQAPPIIVGNTLFGITGQDGTHAGGTVWSFDTAAAQAKINVLHNFAPGVATDVAIPFGAVTYNPTDGLLYGMAFNGGANSLGGIFSLKQDGSDYRLRASFDKTTGGMPQMGAIVFDSNGDGYLNTWNSNAANGGALVKFVPSTNAMTVVSAYNTTTGLSPYNSPAVSKSGKYLYTLTWRGNSQKGGNGALVAIDKATGKATNLYVFDGKNSGGQTFANPTVSPAGDRVITQMSTGGKRGLGTIISIPIPTAFR